MIAGNVLERAARGTALAIALAAGAGLGAAVADTVPPLPADGPGLPVDWSRAQVVTYGDTGLNLYFAFYAAGQQEGIDPTQVEILDLIVRQSIGVDSSLFQEVPEDEELQSRPVFTLLLGAVGTGAPPVWGGPSPNPPPDDFRLLEFLLEVGGETLTAQLTFRTEPDEGPVDPDNPDGPAPGLATGLGEVSFNPQPEPPAFSGGADSLGFGFTFTSFSTAVVELKLLDASRNPIEPTAVEPLRPIPLPATGLLLVGGIAMLGLMRRRRGG